LKRLKAYFYWSSYSIYETIIIFLKITFNISVGIATGYGLDACGSIPGKDKKFFSISQRADPLWGPHSFLSDGYWGLFLRG
jgi:hypothetical protein